MTDEKNTKNSLANLLNQAKKNKNALNSKQQNFNKNSKGFGSPSLVKRSGRGR